ncbi:MAG: hypothetical protein EXR75_12295 [Myxococcales bacterium]|nr:hypothetical protein [Myxococcales bacterium]
MVTEPDGPLGVLDDFDGWAAVSAKLAGRTAQEAEFLLAQFGLGQSWPAADAHWSRELGNDLLALKLERATRYAERCARELERRRAGRAESADVELTSLHVEPSFAGIEEATLPPFLRASHRGETREG